MQWYFTRVCGQSKVSKRWETWNLIKSLYISDEKSWLLNGDFNELLNIEEKWGGNLRSES